MTKKKYTKGLMWFRRDLRACDNAALYHALKTCDQVFGVFVFDKAILMHLPRADRRVSFIHDSLQDLNAQLIALRGPDAQPLLTTHDDAKVAIPRMAELLGVQVVFANHDDEPDALARDAQIRGHLAHAGIMLETYKDQCIFERSEVLTQAERPFGVFTPYKNAWLKKMEPYYLKAYPTEKYASAWAITGQLPEPLSDAATMPSLEEMGFEPIDLKAQNIEPGRRGAEKLLTDFLPRMAKYKDTRDFPSVKGPSYLSVHLRFGTVSIRELGRHAYDGYLKGCIGASSWLSELIWRDFYQAILFHFPQTVAHAFKPAYDRIVWENNEADFEAWCEGKTGYPLVDAGMRELNETGFMHNRVRMVVASFLTKHLLIDWRWGEAYFASKLLDFELSSNNGNWQWAAGTGCDAAPYFRIFNPSAQLKKFDKEMVYIRKWIPEFDTQDYPEPMVDHKFARERALTTYKIGLE